MIFCKMIPKNCDPSNLFTSHHSSRCWLPSSRFQFYLSAFSFSRERLRASSSSICLRLPNLRKDACRQTAAPAFFWLQCSHAVTNVHRREPMHTYKSVHLDSSLSSVLFADLTMFALRKHACSVGIIRGSRLNLLLSASALRRPACSAQACTC